MIKRFKVIHQELTLDKWNYNNELKTTTLYNNIYCNIDTMCDDMSKLFAVTNPFSTTMDGDCLLSLFTFNLVPVDLELNIVSYEVCSETIDDFVQLILDIKEGKYTEIQFLGRKIIAK